MDILHTIEVYGKVECTGVFNIYLYAVKNPLTIYYAKSLSVSKINPHLCHYFW